MSKIIKAASSGRIRYYPKSEIDKYQVSQVFIDLSFENYVSYEKKISNVLKNYHKVNLEEILKNLKKDICFID